MTENNPVNTLKIYWGTTVWNIDINFVFVTTNIKIILKTYV